MSQPAAHSDTRSSAPIDLQQVRRLFAAPEKRVQADFLRREIALRMHERLALVKIAPRHVLDAGCGAGADLSTLQKRFPDAHMLGLDAAPQMLLAAQRDQSAAMSSVNRLLRQWMPGMMGSTQSGAALVSGDFAQLPLAANAVDVVWSNLALHWHPQPDRVFAEWRRVLRLDGLLMFSCFGPDTLKELRGAFAAADSAPHVLPFVDMHDFGDMLVEVGFSTPVMDMETITVTYDTVDKLLADVRAIGGNPLATRPRGLSGKQAWARFTAAVERTRRADGRLALTFEVIYGHAFRPAPRTTADGSAIIRLDLPRK